MLQRLVLGEEAQRHRGYAADRLVEEDPELAARAVDAVHGGGHRRGGQLLEPREVPLDLVGERDDGVEPDHLDRAGRLVHVRARVLEVRPVAGIGAQRGERVEAPGERLVDLLLDPRQRAEVEIGSEFRGHGGRSLRVSLYACASRTRAAFHAPGLPDAQPHVVGRPAALRVASPRQAAGSLLPRARVIL